MSHAIFCLHLNLRLYGVCVFRGKTMWFGILTSSLWDKKAGSAEKNQPYYVL